MTASKAQRRFLAPIEASGLRFGFEPSCKLTTGQITRDRCLVSLGRGSLGRSDAATLPAIERLAAALGLPQDGKAWLRRHHEGAGVVHFGFEAAGDEVVHKLYLEYAGAVRRAMAEQGGPKAPVLVHRALKWRVGTGHSVETHYCLEPSRGLSLDERLAAHGHETGLCPVVAAVRRVLGQAIARASEAELMLMRVADLGSPRRSFDLMVYDAGLTLGDVAEPVAMMEAAFELASGALARVLEPDMASRLGHVAAGLDRAGSPFATFYFGVSGR